MPEYIQLSLYALLLACTVMTLVWWRQLHTKNAGIVDGWWSYIFGFIAILFAIVGSGDPARKYIMVALVVLWSFRLGTHLLVRNTTHTEEDSRYQKLREEYGDRVNGRMWMFFMYQAVSNVILAVPFLIIALDPSCILTVWVWAGIAVWAVAITGESISDHQLKQFKKNPANKGKVCDTGLWKYSRHPNYFFEWLIWMGYALIALDSHYGLIALLSPALMYYLLNNVTGIPMLESLAVKSKGKAYVDYQKTTSAFFPWFKKSLAR